MRRPIVVVAVAALILATATAAGLGIAACGDSSGSATTQAATGPAGGGQSPDMSARFSQALDPLVADGTITSDQETAVVTALTSSLPGAGPGLGGQGQPGQMPSPGATPPSELQGGAPQGSAPDPGRMFSSALDALVSDGTITSAQETAITKALSAAMPQGGPGQQGGTTQSQAGDATSASSAQTY